jgi:hypothetical protein
MPEFPDLKLQIQQTQHATLFEKDSSFVIFKNSIICLDDCVTFRSILEPEE